MKFTDWIRLRSLQDQWQTASDEERKEIEAEKAKIQAKYAKPTKGAGKASENKSTGKTSSSNGSKEPKNQKSGNKSGVVPLSKLPHGEYCDFAEIRSMVKTDKGWMSYQMFREKNPDQNIFDIDPMRISVMYLNQDCYREINSADPNEIMSKCTRKLPAEYEMAELAIINALLYCEAMYDPRIAKLGYEGENMYDFEDNQLYRDYFTNVIYNVLHSDMTLEEARKFALSEEGTDTGEQSTGTGTAQKAGGNNGGKSGKDDKSGAPKENQGTTKADDKKPAPKSQQPPKKPTSKPGGGNSHAWATL